MKFKILFLNFMIFFVFNINAQNKNIIKDSLSISFGLDSIYYLNNLVVYDNGHELNYRQQIGDSIQITSYVLGKYIDNIRQHTYHAVQYMQKGRVITEWRDVNTALKLVKLPGLDTLTRVFFEEQFLGNARVKIESNNFTPADVVKNTQGNLRLLLGGNSYALILYADTMLRVVGYPAAGQNLDLYKVQERVFRNVENTFTLRLR